jgi:hypothetical protein
MTEPTPPPERPLPDDARARIRADLLAHAHERRSSAPRWLAPVGAAAAVALVAGLAYWAISPGDSEQEGLPVTGRGSTTATPTPAPEPSAATATPKPDGTGTPTPAAPETLAETAGTAPAPDDAVQAGGGSCEDELEFVLGGASLALRVDATASFWVKGEKFVLCDELHGRTTVHRALPLTARDDVSTYAVSSDFLDGMTTRSAGGLVPQGAEDVFDVAYTFPDGHTEHGTTAVDDQGRTWWRMTYTYDDGGGNELKKPPIEVTVSLSGVQKRYTLRWGLDTCAQANHGC